MRREVLSLDNNLNTFYHYDLQGSAVRLGTSATPTSFYNLAFDGRDLLTFQRRGANTVVSKVDPVNAILTECKSLANRVAALREATPDRRSLEQRGTYRRKWPANSPTC